MKQVPALVSTCAIYREFHFGCRVVGSKCSCLAMMAVRSRRRFETVITEQQIPLQLILNYDQTWVSAFREVKSTYRKKRSCRNTPNHTRVTKVTGNRSGLSLCTSSFASGEIGPLFISLSNRSVPDKFVEAMNAILGFHLNNRWRKSCFVSWKVFPYLEPFLACIAFSSVLYSISCRIL